MNKLRLTLPLGLMLASTPFVLCQAKKAATAAPKGAHAKSKAEQTDLNAVTALSKNPATTGAQLDAAITDFNTKYPTSDFLGTVATYGLEFYQDPAHTDYEKSLVYGEQAIKADPNSLYALSTVGDIIPDNATDTDLDFDQRMTEATNDDNAVLHIVATAGDKLNGQDFTQIEKNSASATAYTSLARVANLKKDYANSVANYKLALPLEPDVLHKAEDEFYMARVQASAKDYTGALATLDAAAKDGATNPQIASAVAQLRADVVKAQGGH